MTNATTTTPDAYVPGVCNINTAEVKNRRMIGITGLAVFVVLLTALVALPLSRWFRLVLILPAILSISGFLQARNHFCVGYAAAGQQNASEGGSAMPIEVQEAIAKDKARASKMNRQTFVAGVVVGLLTLLLPVMSN